MNMNMYELLRSEEQFEITPKSTIERIEGARAFVMGHIKLGIEKGIPADTIVNYINDAERYIKELTDRK